MVLSTITLVDIIFTFQMRKLRLNRLDNLPKVKQKTGYNFSSEHKIWKQAFPTSTRYFRLGNSLLWEAVLCTVESILPFLVSVCLSIYLDIYFAIYLLSGNITLDENHWAKPLSCWIIKTTFLEKSRATH